MTPELSPHPVLKGYYRDEAERRRFLTHVFDEAAGHYDRIIGFMSLGSGAWYRRWALRRAGLRQGMKALDVAVGTGAVARLAAGIVGPAGEVVGLDPSTGMLGQARRKLSIALVQGVGERLPFRDGVFDFLSMGYAIRHVPDLRHAFGEYLRVLRPGGTVLILDFARPRSPLGLRLGRFYMNTLLPWVTALSSGSQEARLLVHYCWDTVEHSVPPATIVGAMREAGFDGATGVTRFGMLSEYTARRR